MENQKEKNRKAAGGKKTYSGGENKKFNGKKNWSDAEQVKKFVKEEKAVRTEKTKSAAPEKARQKKITFHPATIFCRSSGAAF